MSERNDEFGNIPLKVVKVKYGKKEGERFLTISLAINSIIYLKSSR
ncbi:MAG: hypothetical protein ACTSWY_11405 [Promethearchaeota archaeon]